MTTPGDQSLLLNQILQTLTSFGERLAVVESDLKTVIRDHTKVIDDHEARMRVLEAAAREAVTQEDLAKAEVARSELVANALEQSDRKANKRIGWAALAISIVVAVVNFGLAYLHST